MKGMPTKEVYCLAKIAWIGISHFKPLGPNKNKQRASALTHP